jgi:hypothetical protein
MFVRLYELDHQHVLMVERQAAVIPGLERAEENLIRQQIRVEVMIGLWEMRDGAELSQADLERKVIERLENRYAAKGAEHRPQLIVPRELYGNEPPPPQTVHDNRKPPARSTQAMHSIARTRKCIGS